jgi:hypothetical protein
MQKKNLDKQEIIIESNNFNLFLDENIGGGTTGAVGKEFLLPFLTER